MTSLKEIKAPIKTEMETFESHFRQSMKTKVPLLNVVLNYLLRRKGKQMRPMFVFLTSKMFGEINDSSYTAASLIELLHTATLIHDDVVDESYKRRDYFSINALWKSKVSVLVGDYLLSKGLLLSVENKEFELLEIVSDAVKQMSEGELLQIKKSRKIFIDESEYFKIISKKTASLIAACTACGTRSISTDPALIEKMKSFGEKVGLAFQIKDDLLDYQKLAKIGKPTGNDIKEKKVTLPLIYALQNAGPAEAKSMKKLFGKSKKKHEDVQKVIDFVETHSGIGGAQQKMNELKEEAIQLLKEFPQNKSSESLIKLVNFTTQRKK